MTFFASASKSKSYQALFKKTGKWYRVFLKLSRFPPIFNLYNINVSSVHSAASLLTEGQTAHITA